MPLNAPQAKRFKSLAFQTFVKKNNFIIKGNGKCFYHRKTKKMGSLPIVCLFHYFVQ